MEEVIASDIDISVVQSIKEDSVPRKTKLGEQSLLHLHDLYNFHSNVPYFKVYKLIYMLDYSQPKKDSTIVLRMKQK